MADTDSPLFSAASSSARQLYLLLRCISFSSKTQVQISDGGLRFSVENSSVMEATAFLERGLFTSYQYSLLSAPSPRSDVSDEQVDPGVPVFEISLPSLLETLQIFGSTAESKPNPFSKDSYTSHAFSNQVLGVSGICRLGYESTGDPLTVVIEEPGIRTICELNTYEPSFTSDIPFAREDIALKVIMRASYLHDAIAELGANGPTRLTLSAKKKTFTLSASSPLGSAVVEFHRDAKASFKPTAAHSMYEGEDDAQEQVHGQGAGLLETFLLRLPGDAATAVFSQSYKFEHIAATKRALQSATKVSVRADHQGVLSLQFMIENLEGGGVSFVDFRFVPLVGEDDEHHEDEEADEEEEEEETYEDV